MERIIIIDHNEHRFYIEDVSDEVLAKYNGEEEEFIKNNYDFENYSWDYVTGGAYMRENDEEFNEINFERI